MSKSDDNTNELESYGVWVKNTVGNEPSQQEQTNDLDANNETLDLPDFDETDFSDMFKDDSQFTTEEQKDDFGIDTDTTLSTDELANITDFGDVAIENVDAPEIVEEDISMENAEPIFDTEETKEKSVLDDMPEIVEETAFNVDDILDSPIEEVTDESLMEEATNNESTDSSDEEEISLDDFLEDGFSDESVASGNNGYEAGAEPEVSKDVTNEFTEEISLDDFLDDASFDEAPVSKKEPEVDEEEPLEMDITFDDSVDNVETEDNLSLDNDDTIEDFDDMASDDNIESEEVSLDDFGLDSESNKSIEESDDFVADTTSDNLTTEEIDLSDFGIDENADETPIVQDVETQKNKEQVVDYDLFIGNDESTSSAPVVNEIKEEENNDNNEVEHVEVEPEQTNTTTIENSLLQQIVADLSSLKDEIKNIKTDIADIKAKEAAAEKAAIVPTSLADTTEEKEIPIEESEPVNVEADIADVLTEEPLSATDDLNLPEVDNVGGFFNSDDTDETIALSGDELSNIMNNAEFSEPVDAGTTTDIEPIDLVDNTEEVIEEEPKVISEESFDNSIEETAIEDESELVIDDIENTEEITTEEPVIPSSDTTLDSLDVDNFLSNDNDIINDGDNLSFNYEDENLVEPSLDDIDIETEEETSEDLPDEISIPKDDDIFVESTSSDFMDSVKDSTDDLMGMSEPVEEISEVDEVESLDDVEPIEEIEDISPIIDEEVEQVEEITTQETGLEELSDDDDEGFTTIDDVINNPPVEEVELEEVPTVEMLLEEDVPEDDSFADVTDFSNNEEISTTDKSETEDNFADVTDFDAPVTETVEEEVGFADVTDFEEPTTEEDDSFADVTEFESEEATQVIEEPEEPVIEETEIPVEEETEPAFDEVDELNNDLSSSNIDYLTTKEDVTTDNDGLNGELKKEIKSVLLYMDQLLENLPEEKIYEFAKSEEFATYKKLFKDLGLS